jgi:hypothetical protein
MNDNVIAKNNRNEPQLNDSNNNQSETYDSAHNPLEQTALSSLFSISNDSQEEHTWLSQTPRIQSAKYKTKSNKQINNDSSQKHSTIATSIQSPVISDRKPSSIAQMLKQLELKAMADKVESSEKYNLSILINMYKDVLADNSRRLRHMGHKVSLAPIQIASSPPTVRNMKTTTTSSTSHTVNDESSKSTADAISTESVDNLTQQNAELREQYTKLFNFVLVSRSGHTSNDSLLEYSQKLEILGQEYINMQTEFELLKSENQKIKQEKEFSEKSDVNDYEILLRKKDEIIEQMKNNLEEIEMKNQQKVTELDVMNNPSGIVPVYEASNLAPQINMIAGELKKTSIQRDKWKLKADMQESQLREYEKRIQLLINSRQKEQKNIEMQRIEASEKHSQVLALVRKQLKDKESECDRLRIEKQELEGKIHRMQHQMRSSARHYDNSQEGARTPPLASLYFYAEDEPSLNATTASSPSVTTFPRRAQSAFATDRPKVVIPKVQSNTSVRYSSTARSPSNGNRKSSLLPPKLNRKNSNDSKTLTNSKQLKSPSLVSMTFLENPSTRRP